MHHHQQRNQVDVLPGPGTEPPPKRACWNARVYGIAAGCVALAAAAWMLIPPVPTEIEWAAVANRLSHVHTVSCRVTYLFFDSYGHVSAYKHAGLWFRAPDQSREVYDPPSARLPDAWSSAVEVLAHLCNMDSKRIVQKGEEVLHGRDVIRFEQPTEAIDASYPPGVMIIWVDVETGLPVRVKGPAPSGQSDQNLNIELDGIQFDPQLSDATFALPNQSQMTRRDIVP